MAWRLAILWLLLWSGVAHAAPVSRIEHATIESAAIGGNPAGISAVRGVTVYLPAGYDRPGRRFPIVYYLSGFFEDDCAPYAKRPFDTLRANGVGLV